MDSELFKKLACVKCLSPSLKQEQNQLICSKCGQHAFIINNIPDFLSSFCVYKVSWGLEGNGRGYDATIAQVEPYRLRRIDEPLLKYAKGDVLEIGCGTARLAKPTEERGARYFGLDPVMDFLQHASVQHKLTRLVRGQGERLPFQNESFDRLISGYYAYRFVNSELALPEARRVLKKGGIFVFDTLNYWFNQYMELRRIIRHLDWRRFPFILRSRPSKDLFEFISLSQLKQQAKKAGFAVERVISTPSTPIYAPFNKYLSGLYLRGPTVYLGSDVIIVLKVA